ncbi:MAG: 16S rRNA (cytosine(1402)-N(4))-methyltransferase, partial [Alloprevotella tannerae]|nr:16S rRNA (cytosine(1402)-N(4))-methyltransferase [Alloprevotella tannerae]
KPGGRLAILTYHSLEDRLVKNFIKAGNATGKVEQDFYGNRLAPMKPVNGRVIRPDEAEMNANPRSRSAKLRIGACIAKRTDGK